MIKHLAGRTLLALVIIYALILCLMLILRAVMDNESTVIAAINVSITLLLMPSLLLFPLCLVLRRWRIAALLTPPFLAFMVTYLPFFLPRPIDATPDAPRFTFLTYNLHAERTILTPMVELIRQANADIVALQEMSPEASDAFDTQLNDLYPYRALFPAPDGTPYHGRGLLSHYPITDVKSWPVEYPIPVRLMTAVVNMPMPITVYNFHAPPSYPIYGQGFDIHPRGQQIDDILAMIANQSGPILWMGDFNTNDADLNYAHIVAHMRDTYREVGWGMGFTGPDWSHPQSQEGLPFIPIHQRMDYIFHNQFFLPVESHVWSTSGGSDHRPVFAELTICTTC
jgi:vancomycin resistance protein VanJ